MKRGTLFLLLASFSLTSCTGESSSDRLPKKYFDLKTFFRDEAEVLKKRNPHVEKTVAKNDLKESKSVTIRNWTNELELFSASDINKPAWNDQYETKIIGNSIQYLAKDSSLRTKQITVSRSAEGKVTHIFILNDLRNNLYSSTERLHYYPDSLYTIEKQQKILIIGDNAYSIIGRLTPAKGRTF